MTEAYVRVKDVENVLENYAQRLVHGHANSDLAAVACECLKRVKRLDLVTVHVDTPVRCHECDHCYDAGNGVLRCPYSVVDLDPGGSCHRGKRETM